MIWTGHGSRRRYARGKDQSAARHDRSFRSFEDRAGSYGPVAAEGMGRLFASDDSSRAQGVQRPQAVVRELLSGEAVSPNRRARLDRTLVFLSIVCLEGGDHDSIR